MKRKWRHDTEHYGIEQKKTMQNKKIILQLFFAHTK